MEVHLSPELQKVLADLVSRTGRPASDLLEGAFAGYAAETGALRDTLDCRYDEIKSGKVTAVDGEEFMASLLAKNKARHNAGA